MTDGRPSANRRDEAIRHALRAALTEAGAARLLVACSGGPDSVCLLNVVAHEARQYRWRVRVGHVRHQARADDDCDAAVAKHHATRLGLPFDEVALAPPTTEGTQSEATMRDARYRALATMAAHGDCDAILTGHTLDDQAETMLLHLFRGAGLDGLSGMAVIGPLPIRRDSPHGDHSVTPVPPRLIRPLLSVRRLDTHAYCADHGLPVAHDPSNTDEHYLRNWLRRQAMPTLQTRLGDFSHRLARGAERFAADADFLREHAATALARCVASESRACVALDAARFRAEHVAMQRRMVRAQLERLTGNVPRAEDVERFRAATLGHSSRVINVGNLAACLAYGRVIIGTPAAVDGAVLTAAGGRHPTFHGCVEVRPGIPTELPAPRPGLPCSTLRIAPLSGGTPARAIPEGAVPLCLPPTPTIVVRNRAQGDRFQPAARGHAMRLRDYLTEQRVPALVRDWLPLLVVNGTIAWVLGYDVAASFACPPASATHAALIATRP